MKQIIRILAVLMAALLAVAVLASCDKKAEPAGAEGSDGLEYYPLPDGTYAVGGGTAKYLTEVEIPAIHNGKAVTVIMDYAFQSFPNLNKITIPNSVTSIGSSAFENCSSLTSIAIPDSVTNIDYYAFNGCSSLTSITIPNSVTSIGNEAFRGCSSLTSITIPDSVTSIDCYTFYGCSSLTSITIPNGVTSIGGDAFFGCSSLTSITYTGTKTQWCHLSKPSSFLGVIVTCSNGIL